MNIRCSVRFSVFLFVILLAGCRPAPAPAPTAAPPVVSATLAAEPTLVPVLNPTTSAPTPTGAPAPTATGVETPPAVSTSTAALATLVPPSASPVITAANASEVGVLIELDFTPWGLISALAWAPGSSLLAVSAGEWIHMYLPGEWQELGRVHAGALSPGLAFSPDGTRLAVGSRDGSVQIWRLAPGAPVTPDARPELTIAAHRKGTNRLAFSPDGTQLASGGNDGMIRIWEVNSGEEQQAIIGGSYAIPDLAFSPDGTRLAIVNGDVVRLREVGSGRISGSLRAETGLYSVAWQPGAERLVTGGHAANVSLWDVPAESSLRAYGDAQTGHQDGPLRYDSLVWDVDFSPDGALFASAGGDGRMLLWDIAQERPVFTAINPAAVTSVAFSPDGRWLAGGRLDGIVILWAAAVAAPAP